MILNLLFLGILHLLISKKELIDNIIILIKILFMCFGLGLKKIIISENRHILNFLI